MTKTRKQMIRFLFIGVTSTSLYFFLLLIFQPFVSSIIFLTAICYTISMAFNFMAQALFTFQVQNLSPGKFLRYIIMHGCALLLNSIAMTILVNNLGLQILVSQVFVTGFITIMTFALSKSWVYN